MEEQYNEHGKILISWVFSEFAKYRRTFVWYIGILIVSIGLLVYALLTANFLFALIIVMMAVIILVYRIREPAEIKFSVTEDGIGVESKFYPWADFKNFWIIYKPPEVKTLYLDFKGLRPTLPIHLENQNPVRIREILLQYLKEDVSREGEPVGDELGRWLKI